MRQKDFYATVCENYSDKEIVRVIMNDPSCGFYELCQAFLDIALNAETIKDKSGELKRLFKHVDINKAKAQAREFCIRNEIKQIDELFAIIKSEFHASIASDDKRRTEAMIKDDDQSKNTYGYIGTLYFFNEISDNVYDETVSEIKLSLMSK